MPEEFGRYRLGGLLGRGGMGEVHRAYDTVRQRTVALKLLPAEFAHDEMFKARFRRESLLAARLNEPHIIPIHDFGEIDGRLFLDMRLVEGTDLGSAIATQGRLAPSIAVDIIDQIAAALDSAHASGLVHRDVKPSNVLLTGGSDHPFAYLVDFGIARSVGAAGTALTATSSTIGTIAYMAPERLAGEPGDHRVDIYALACVLYEMLTGQRPFDGEMPALMYGHMHLPPPRASTASTKIPPALDGVIAQGMAKNPIDRYPKASDLADAAHAAISQTQHRYEAPTAHPPLYASATPGGPTTAIAAPRLPPPSKSDPPPPQSSAPAAATRRKRWLLVAAAVLVLGIAATTTTLALDHTGPPTAAATSHSSTNAATHTSSGSAATSIAACEQTHQLIQAATTAQHGAVSTFMSCTSPPSPGADPDGFLLITAYTLSTPLPESSGASEYDFIVGPCATFRLAYSFASQGTSKILPPFTINQGQVTMEGSESSTVSLATADPGLSDVPNPATGQAVYLHNSSNIINQASCVQSGSTPAAVPPQILVSATATG